MLLTRAGILGPVFVTAIERFIGAGDESFAPFDESGGEKASDHANNYLLQKRGVHGVFGSRCNAAADDAIELAILILRSVFHAVIPNPERFRGEGPHESTLDIREVLRFAQDDSVKIATFIFQFPSPETPLMCAHDPQPEEKICHRVNEHT
jgi:hypothetical protein